MDGMDFEIIVGTYIIYYSLFSNHLFTAWENEENKYDTFLLLLN